MSKQNYERPSWDEYFLYLIKVIGIRGTCDRGRSGAVIVRDKRILSTGYIGSPIGLEHCDDVGHEMHIVFDKNGKETQHCVRTAHAEQNAIVNATRDGVALKGGTMYCKMTPCYTCAKMIINAGLKRVVCEKDYQAGERSKEIFKETEIEFVLMSKEIEKY